MGDVSGLELGLPEKKRLLLNGLCQLVQGDGWAWSLTEQTGDRVVCLDAMSGGDDRLLPKRGLPLGLKSSGGDRTAKSLLRGKAKNLSGKASRSVADGQLKTPLTLCICELAGNTASRIMFGRRAGRPAFSARDEEMARIVAEETTWLHELNPVCTPLQTELHLSPREREIFALLGEGLSSKAISERLGISSYTFRDYIKAIYRSVGIRSRAEAIKQFDLLKPQIDSR